MLKKIFSLRNIIFAVIIVAFAAVIAGQQSVLNEKESQYKAALAEKKRIEKAMEELDINKQMADSEILEEERARENGYLYPDEIRIEYKD
ncbi:MAG: hypothetical protein IJS71_03530 [Clostridia bacterium]|nr:hypothetical protein [Clostridia bacterium]